MKIFLDTEFTGLHKETTLISIGLVAESGEEFYAELTDYDKSQVNSWIKENVLSQLKLDTHIACYSKEIKPGEWLVKGGRKFVGSELREWLTQFKNVEIWGDVLAYDWVLFVDLVADYSEGYPKLPANVFYIPFDFTTLLKLKGIDPNIKRIELVPQYQDFFKGTEHYALMDALLLRECYKAVMKSDA